MRSERTAAFELLDDQVKRWIWDRRWPELREIQARAIEPILARSGDLILAAATAAGKTEAAFLPVLTSLRKEPVAAGVAALYISPLKALINDQHQRLEALCELTEIPLSSWHGDIAAERKERVREKPEGVLLITPESLESIFVNHGSAAAKIFAGLRYVVIDELHAFIGSERGRQLQSLLHRIELAGRQRAMRIGLSATLGEMGTAAEFLRPGGGAAVELITSSEDPRTLKVALRGYLAKEASHEESGEPDGLSIDGDRLKIAAHLYSAMRGHDNLVFTNSRASVEEFADLLRRRCEDERVPIEFFPHHGSLSKALREDVEQRLREDSGPTTAICTSTLELGIDVGSVRCVGQIDPPFSAAALRQRLGRSGRRPEDPSVLRMYVTESDLGPGVAPSDELREGLVQSIALVEALVDHWFEPPIDGALHLSTLVQQVLSVIAQSGGARAEEIWGALCGSGPFELGREDFVLLLRGLAAREVIQQTGDRELILAPRGEQIVGHYSFYSAFTSSEEYRLLADGSELGTMPISSPLREDSFLIFGGRRWRVVEIDGQRRVIVVVRAAGGRVPRFHGEGGELHDEIRRRMRAIYTDEAVPRFLDPRAEALLAQGRAAFAALDLAHRQIVPFGSGSAYFPWRGDRVSASLALGIRAAGHPVEVQGLAVIAERLLPDELRAALLEAFGPESAPDPIELAGTVRNLETQKHHHLLEPELLLRDCATARLDVTGAKAAVAELASTGEARLGSAPTRAARAMPSTARFVALDCETTGLHPGAQHRIIELALLSVDERGEITERWSSLLRPQRDLGPTDIHGIHAREVAGAPIFAEVLGEVAERLAGRVLVAHNARFDRAFLESELARSGASLAPLPILCTMELASRLAIGGVRRRLDDCRASLGLEATASHTALADAEAAAAILAAYLKRYGGAVESLVSGKVRPAVDWPTDGPRAKPKLREPAFSRPLQPAALAGLIAEAALAGGEEASDVLAYRDVLERAIEDRRLDGAEREELIATASLLGIGAEELERIHRDYVERLIAAANRDGEITSREREDLFLVAEALGVPDVKARLAEPRASAPAISDSSVAGSLRGKSVCFTGEMTCQYEGARMSRERARELALAAGLEVHPRVTKKLDLLVLADPNSDSGKARKAREYGTRLVAETVFWELIGVEVC